MGGHARGPAGRWRVAGASHDPRRAAPRVCGHIDFHPGLLRSRLVARIEGGSEGAAASTTIVVEAQVEAIDPAGDLLLAGVTTIGGAPAGVRLAARYHGTFRHGEAQVAWLTLWADAGRAGPPVGPPPSRLRRGARPRRLFSVEVNAEPALTER